MQWHQCLHHRVLNAFFASGGTSKFCFITTAPGTENVSCRGDYTSTDAMTATSTLQHLWVRFPLIVSRLLSAAARVSWWWFALVDVEVHPEACLSDADELFFKQRLSASTGEGFFLISRIIIDWVLLSVGSFRSLTSPSGMTKPFLSCSTFNKIIKLWLHRACLIIRKATM